tara:strand:+ start:49 stop:216 length:168 start_codon:yes stop_codon:yes gene_type:complete
MSIELFNLLNEGRVFTIRPNINKKSNKLKSEYFLVRIKNDINKIYPSDSMMGLEI